MPDIKLYNKWEEVSEDSTAGILTQRLRVQGGWVVRVKDLDTENQDVCFVSDPQGEWRPSDAADPD